MLDELMCASPAQQAWPRVRLMRSGSWAASVCHLCMQLMLVKAAIHVLLRSIKPVSNPALQGEHQMCLQACSQEGSALLMLLNSACLQNGMFGTVQCGLSRRFLVLDCDYRCICRLLLVLCGFLLCCTPLSLQAEVAVWLLHQGHVSIRPPYAAAACRC